MIHSPLAARRTLPPHRRTWRAILFAPLLLLATCGPAADTEIRFAGTLAARPSAAATVPARFTDGAFIATDGARLPLRKWLPQGPVKATVLALHGFNDYSHAFDTPARIWAERGIATYAYDQRGFGGAPGRGAWAGEAALAIDAIAATRLLRRAYPGRPIYLFGESMGGAVAIVAASGEIGGVVPTDQVRGVKAHGPDGIPTADADAIILSAPAVWGRATMDLLPKVALFAGARLFPTLSLSGSGLRILASDNLPMLRALARDPLVLKGARIDTIFGLVDLMDSAFAAAPRLDAPTLLLYGAHDEIVPRRPIAEFVAQLPPEPRQPHRLAYYPTGYHLLLRDLAGGIVAEDVASWIFDRSAPLPSRADGTATARPWPPPPERGAAAGLAPAGARR
jgi:alpha-beta hydrolase superfamily lysophospholipase